MRFSRDPTFRRMLDAPFLPLADLSRLLARESLLRSFEEEAEERRRAAGERRIAEAVDTVCYEFEAPFAGREFAPLVATAGATL
jgi:hypothetical protein